MFPQGSPADPPLASRTRPAPFRGRAGFLRPSRGFPSQAAPKKRHFPPESAPRRKRRPRAVRLPGGRKAATLAPHNCPGAERPPPSCRAIAWGPKGSRPCAARFQEGCGHVRQPCARRFSGDGRPPPLRRAISWGRKAFALAPRDCPGAGRQPPSRRAIVQGPKGRCPCTARFQEGCRHARQPCAKRFRETGGRRPRAAQMPGGRKAVALAPALPGGRGRTGCVHSPFAPAWDAAPGMGGA